MVCAAPWPRLTSLQAAGLPTSLHRRALVARALATNAIAVQSLLEGRSWLMPEPAVPVTHVEPEGRGSEFLVIRDDLTHPLIGGNKWRKLDGLWPQLQQATDIVTCGGLQSAHTLAVAAAAAQHGKRAHLLVRGERPVVPTGSHLYARMLAHRVVYVSRAEYADRAAMFASYLRRLQSERQRQGTGAGHALDGGQLASAEQLSSPPAASGLGSTADGSGCAAVAGSAEEWAASQGVALVPEGAAEPAALLGLIRQVAWLAGSPLSPLSSSSGWDGSCGSLSWRLVVDSGTGATATGLALGAALLGLPWRVTGVILAGAQDYYQQQQRQLVSAFCQEHQNTLKPSSSSSSSSAQSTQAAASDWAAEMQAEVEERLTWTPRLSPRKFGKALPGEVAQCQAVAQRHGILLDPIWNLAAWEAASQLAAAARVSGSGERVAMVHTGGHLGLCGLAQRWPDQF